MHLQCGIVGLPNVGKSTLFNVLSNAKAVADNFPFCTIEPNQGIVNVPDERLHMLAHIVQPQKVIPTTITFVDIAGLVKGASQGEGLGNQFLSHIRNINAIIHVIRCFENDNIVHVAGNVDPIFDKHIIDYELQQKDLETIQKKIAKSEKIAKSGDKEAKKQIQLLKKVAEKLQQGISIRTLKITVEERQILNSWQLLTTKPIIYVANIDEETLKNKNKHIIALQKKIIEEENTSIIPICMSLESQMIGLDTKEKKFFLEEYGIAKTGLDYMIQSAYSILDLITFFTVGKKEVRAWTIKKNTKAPQAAGAIHSDFERGFIKAAVIKYPDYITYKTEQACKEAGKLHIEGKNYIVEDGDIIHFRHNI